MQILPYVRITSAVAALSLLAGCSGSLRETASIVPAKAVLISTEPLPETHSVQDESHEASRPLVLNVDVLSLSPGTRDIDWDAAFRTGGEKAVISRSPDTPGCGGQLTLLDSTFARSGALRNALSRQGKLLTESKAAVVTNGTHPVALQNMTQHNIVKRIRFESADGISTKSVDMAPGSTGFSMQLWPSLNAEPGEVTLRYAAHFSYISGIYSTEADGMPIDMPLPGEFILNESVQMHFGQTLMFCGAPHINKSNGKESISIPVIMITPALHA